MQQLSEIQFILEQLTDINRVLAKNTTVLEHNTKELKEHIRRTNLLEQQMQVALIPIKVLKVFTIYVLPAIAGLLGAYYSWLK